MRVLHTSDWHLGHRLFSRSRAYEHQHFLAWLLEQLQRREVDLLLIAGDIFDTANPPAQALTLWYSFLAACAKHLRDLQIIVVGGNHDSAARLDAPSELLSALEIQVVGGARREGRLRQPQELVIPVRKRGGEEILAWVAAVPFLRPMDLPMMQSKEGQDPLIEGVRTYYSQVFDSMRAMAQPGQRLLAMGHLYLRKGQLSEWSERKVLGGNQHALPEDIFPEWLDYVALGHLHRPQAISRESVRYCGSPIPLAMDERSYPHRVNLLSWKDTQAQLEVESISVPRSLPLYRIPEKGCLELDALSEAIERDLPAQLQAEPPAEVPRMAELGQIERPLPFVEFGARLVAPDPELRDRLEALCEAKGLRLSSLVVEYAGAREALGESKPERDLRQFQPEEVLAAIHESTYGEAIEPELLELFGELVDVIHQERQA